MRYNFLLAAAAFLLLFATTSLPARAGCIDAYGLFVSHENIYAYIENSDNTSHVVTYIFYVDDEEINRGTVSIAAEDKVKVSHLHNFAAGRYDVGIEVETDCGTDQEHKVYTQLETQDCTEPDICTEGALRCDCDNKRIYICKDNRWAPLAEGRNEYCEYCDLCGCEGESYLFHEPCVRPGCMPEDGCGVMLEEFSYIDNVEENGKARVQVKVRNTGIKEETIFLRFYLDGLLKGSSSVELERGQATARTFIFYPSPGTHSIKVSAKSDCQASDYVSRIINVIESGKHVEPPKPPEPEPEPTSIKIAPVQMDIPRYDARAVAVTIHTKEPQYFRIDVRDQDFEAGWLRYEKEFRVEGDRTVLIYVTPEAYGKYGMDVYVTARTEWKTVKEHVTFFVSSPKEKKADWIAGFMYFFTHPATVLIAILLSLGMVVFAGTRLLIPEPDAWKSR